MRAVARIIIVLLLALAGLRAKAADLLPASAVTWMRNFGISTVDTNTLFSLKVGHGYFGRASTNVQSVVNDWLKVHPQAVVVSVMSRRHFTYAWVVQGHDNLNVELVRHGCISPETQILNPGETPDVPQEDYDAFVLRVTKAGESAKQERLGIWGS